MLTCNGDCDGSAIILAQGGNDDGYFYHWQESGIDGSVSTTGAGLIIF
ncbi:MAG: hypothetical protein R2771_00465 [Saprospiraceae bacterium]